MQGGYEKALIEACGEDEPPTKVFKYPWAKFFYKYQPSSEK